MALKSPRDYVPALPAILATGLLAYRPSMALALAVAVLGALGALALWLEAREGKLAERLEALESLPERLTALEAQSKVDRELLTRVSNRTTTSR